MRGARDKRLVGARKHRYSAPDHPASLPASQAGALARRCPGEPVEFVAIRHRAPRNIPAGPGRI